MVSFGALLGSNLRFIIYKKIDDFLFIRKEIKILLINNIATFLLGLFYAHLVNKSYTENIYYYSLFILIGFLGSLSTFSTFIYDIFQLATKNKFLSAIKLIFYSIFSGLIFFGFGFLLGGF
tara:strand:- start:894 stop:1256 length:363 start_codon:yes stop_codon:yes gene_type:complete